MLDQEHPLAAVRHVELDPAAAGIVDASEACALPGFVDDRHESLLQGVDGIVALS